MKNILISLIILFSIYSCERRRPPLNEKEDYTTIIKKADQALTYCLENDLNTDFCILINMGIHSGKNRFFVYDFKENKILQEHLVSHGCGNNPWSNDYSKQNPQFSNIQDSHLSSLGKYKIGKRGWSNFGVHINYRLHGLESTNSNANKRDIVFHSWSAVTDKETYPYGTAEGWGCPAISNNAFLKIDPLLMSAEKPTLMWVFK